MKWQVLCLPSTFPPRRCSCCPRQRRLHGSLRGRTSCSGPSPRSPGRPALEMTRKSCVRKKSFRLAQTLLSWPLRLSFTWTWYASLHNLHFLIRCICAYQAEQKGCLISASGHCRIFSPICPICLAVALANERLPMDVKFLQPHWQIFAVTI